MKAITEKYTMQWFRKTTLKAVPEWGYLLFAAVVLFFAVPAQAQKVAVKNNLLIDLIQTPNISIEFGVSPKWTIGANVSYNAWWHHVDGTLIPFGKGNARGAQDHVQWRHFFVEPEARYWFCSTFAGHFIGFDAFYTHFNMGNVKFPFGLYPSLKSKRRQGDGVGIGAFYGHSWILSPHWSIEAVAGVNVGYAWFKDYECSHCGTFIKKDNKPFVAPKIGINAVYNIK